MRSIMPPGYSAKAKRKKLEAELRQAKAAQLAAADPAERARLEKEISDQIDKELKKIAFKFRHFGVLWSH